MGWRDLLQTQAVRFPYPWVGLPEVWAQGRLWYLPRHESPRTFGWYEIEGDSRRRARVVGTCVPASETITQDVRIGYLAGDRLIPENTTAAYVPLEELSRTERVCLVEPCDPFTRVSVGRAGPGQPLVFRQQEFPSGPEAGVFTAFLSKAQSVRGIPGVSPALEATFRLEGYWRDQIEERRRQEQAQREAEERQREAERLVGTAEGRRRLALQDFEAAVRAALLVGGALYLRHRPAHQPGEMIVWFEFQQRHFSCVCRADTFRIIDAGICLDDGITRGDDLFTLESLPSVIAEAIREGVLHVTRH